MRYANVNGEKVEAFLGLVGECPGCNQTMVPHCGNIKIHHWAHKGKRNCDPWWENETEWHRTWKDQFPKDWQEAPHTDESTGEKHFADVKTPQGWVLEFQHSPIKSEEKLSRNQFYKKIIWVVDGTRRMRDKPKLLELWESGRKTGTNPVVRQIHFPEESALLRDWGNSSVPVFVDFGEEQLWWILPPIKNQMGFAQTLVVPFAKDDFIDIHRKGLVEDFIAYLNDYSGLFSKNIIQKTVSRPTLQAQSQVPQRPKYYNPYRARRKFRL